jgi:hypothetical protein
MRLYGDTDKRSHGYVEGYEQHLRRRRLGAHRILEIGVGGYRDVRPGGSLRIWRDCFPRSRIVGLDISAKQVALGPRVGFVQGDQADPEALDRAVAALGGPPSIVIDDGSHLGDHAERSFAHLFPLMDRGSLYVVEDLHTSYWPKFGGGPSAPNTTAVGFIRTLIDDVQAEDPTFRWPTVRDQPDHAGPTARHADVALLDVRPGIAFIQKAGRSG